MVACLSKNSCNLDQAVKLFKKKYAEVLFVIEWQWDINKILKNYLIPLGSHNIISHEDSALYQDLICDIELREKEQRLTEKMQQNQTFLNLLHQSELEGKAEDVIEAIR